MGMLDGMLGQVLSGSLGGSAAQADNPLSQILGSLAGGSRSSTASGAGVATGGVILAAIVAMLQQQGGIGAVLDKLRNSGLGQHADSWVGSGANLPVNVEVRK